MAKLRIPLAATCIAVVLALNTSAIAQVPDENVKFPEAALVAVADAGPESGPSAEWSLGGGKAPALMAVQTDAGVIMVPVPEPGANLPRPDVVEQPAQAAGAVMDIFRRSGLWSSIMYALFLLGRAASRRAAPDNWLGKGGRGAMLFAGVGLLGAVCDVLIVGTPWLVAVIQALFYAGMALQALPLPKKKA